MRKYKPAPLNPEDFKDFPMNEIMVKNQFPDTGYTKVGETGSREGAIKKLKALNKCGYIRFQGNAIWSTNNLAYD